MKLTLELENETIDSPSAERLEQALATVGHPNGSESAILSRSEESYIQTAGNLQTGFMIEYREGSAASHRSSKSGSIPHSEMVRAFLAYHHGSEEWKGMFEWNKGAFSGEPFERRWLIALVVYFVGALIALYVYSTGALDSVMPGLPLAVFAPIFVFLGLQAIYTGEVGGPLGAAVYRSKNPIRYWVLVAMLLFCGILLFLASLLFRP